MCTVSGAVSEEAVVCVCTVSGAVSEEAVVCVQ